MMIFDKSRWNWSFCVFAVLAGAMCLALPVKAQSGSVENVLKGKLMYSTHSRVLAPFSGRLVGFDHACGQRVEKGQVLGWVELTKIDWRNLKNRLSKMQNTIANQPGRRKLELQKEQLLKRRQAEQELIDKGFSAKDAVADIDVELEMVIVALKEFDENIKRQKADLKFELTSLKEKFKHNVNPAKLPRKAPIMAESGSYGYIVAVYSQERFGQLVGANTPLMTLSEVDPMIVQAQVFERDVVALSIGDVAKIRVDALGGREFEAVLTKISWMPLQQSFDSPSYYEIELEVDNSELEMKEGFEVQVVFTN